MRHHPPGRKSSERTLKSQALPAPQGFLASCMVDGDENAHSRAGIARGKALGVSAIAQACLLTLVLIVPLLATNHPISVRNAVPIAPYGGMPRQPQEFKPRPLGPPSESPFSVPFVPNPTDAIRHPVTGDESTPRGGSDAPVIPGAPWGSDHSDVSNIGIIPIGGFPEAPQPPQPESDKKPVANPVAVSEGAELAQLIRRVEPVYPVMAIRSHIEGTVQMRAIIGRDGSVREMRVVSGNAILAYAAQEAVKQWRFRPTILNGQPVEVDTFFNVVFKINQ